MRKAFPNLPALSHENLAILSRKSQNEIYGIVDQAVSLEANDSGPMQM
jgi:hypothetical protein